MSRSLKKKPYVEERLLKRIEKLLSKQQSEKQVNNYLEKDDNFYMV